MPTYEYVCRDCGQHLEVVQSFKDESLTICPACEGTLRKFFTAAGIVFKGSGWHIKDYASSTKRGPSSSSSEGTSSSESGDAKGSKESTGSKDAKDTSSSSPSTSGSDEKKSA